MDKVRCPLHKASMALSFDKPEVLAPPEEAPACCRQQTITVPPSVNAKTAQRRDYPSRAWRRSYARRSASRIGSRATHPAPTAPGPRRLRHGGAGPCTAVVTRSHRILAVLAQRAPTSAELAAADPRGGVTRTRRRAACHTPAR